MLLLLWSGVVSWFVGLVCCVRAFECYLDVCLLEKVGNFSNIRAVVGEIGPIFVFIIGFVLVGFVFNCSMRGK
jgi:hypothetical protein